MPKGIYATNGQQNKPKQYAPALVETVRNHYTSGLTHKEIAEVLSVSQKVIYRVMRNHAIPTRRSIPRDQSGPKNPQWKGDAAGYDAFHLRVVSRRGQPSRCEECGTDDPAKKYEWASVTRRYEDVFDYRRLCASCHRKFDNAIDNIRGRKAS